MCQIDGKTQPWVQSWPPGPRPQKPKPSSPQVIKGRGRRQGRSLQNPLAPGGGSQRVKPEIKTPTQFCRCFTPLIPPSGSAHSAGPPRKAPQCPRKAPQCPLKLVFWIFVSDLKIGTKNGRLKMRPVVPIWCPRVITWSPKSPKISKK